ncbi:hypothetical protein ACFQ4C_15405 [Larkinella insperata]|uniref:Uncharacterized protein n=1 Tax=Larkinella insperata TaxID=332158 RepID=A0ABW3QAE0_9BACT|nr:hypothetical protein [Larkinella insperata]
MRYLKLRAIVLFYRTFWLFSNAVTLGLIGVSLNKMVCYFPLFFVYFWWFKLLSEGAVWYLIRRNYRAQFWFYHNLGLSEAALFGGAFVLDSLIALLLIFGIRHLLLVL